jgi:hypothetical protein
MLCMRRSVLSLAFPVKPSSAILPLVHEVGQCCEKGIAIVVLMIALIAGWAFAWLNVPLHQPTRARDFRNASQISSSENLSIPCFL